MAFSFSAKKANVDDTWPLFSYSDKKKLKSKGFRHFKTQKNFEERSKTKAFVYEINFPRFFLPAWSAILDSSICYAYWAESAIYTSYIYGQTVEAKNMADFWLIWRHFTQYPWQPLMVVTASQAQFWARGCFAPPWIFYNDVLQFLQQMRTIFMKLFHAFAIYWKMHKLHMPYLPWRGRRMKRNLKLVINCDALMIMARGHWTLVF